MDALVFVDAVIVITLLESAWLVWRRRKGLWSASLACTLAAGLCLMLALRASLAGAGLAWIVAAVSAAGVLHVADLALRVSTAVQRPESPDQRNASR
jgi:hypothetical protein